MLSRLRDVAGMSSETRSTKYSKAIVPVLARLGHATNARLLSELRQQFPEVSATTVHRATARLADRGEIAIAPPAPDGSMRYDANTTPHDHFACQACSNIRDLHVASELIPRIETELGGCKISGQLLVSGVCGHCLSHQVRKEDI